MKIADFKSNFYSFRGVFKINFQNVFRRGFEFEIPILSHVQNRTWRRNCAGRERDTDLASLRRRKAAAHPAALLPCKNKLIFLLPF